MSNSTHTRRRNALWLIAWLGTVLGFCHAAVTLGADLDSMREFDIAPQSLDSALIAFSKQADLQVIGATQTVADTRTQGVSGRFRSRDALTTLLRGTPLSFDAVGQHSVRIVPTRAATARDDSAGTSRHAQTNTPAQSIASDQDARSVEFDESIVTIPEVLVVGSKLINADIKRTEDDPQPYVVFDRAQIERSMSPNLEEFLRKRLPMNTVQGANSQAVGGFGNQSSINLRGLGTSQTLILVDGRRMPSVNNTTLGFMQPDINGIPLAAIERIEVLPSTASGIYGGGATGGVVNIVTRKDYSGLDLSAAYGNTFEVDAPNHRFDVSVGFSLEEGRTQLLIAASHAQADPLLVGDREFVARARALQLANNPSALLGAAAPPLGYTSNVRSENGSNLVLDDGTPLNSSITHVPVGYAGPQSDGGAALVANAGRYNLELPDTVLGARQSLLNDPKVESASLSLRREFGTRVAAFTDVSWFDNQSHVFNAVVPNMATLAAAAPNNPFTTAVAVSFPATGLSFPIETGIETVRATGGVIVRLPKGWTAAADYVWSRSRYSFSQTSPAVGDSVNSALSNGTLDVMRDLNAFPLNWSHYLLPSPNQFTDAMDTILEDVTARVSGSLLPLPGGPLTLSALIERRDEEASESFRGQMSGSAVRSTTFFPERSQAVSAYYVEVRAPLWSQSNARGLLRALELQASVRRDEYETRAPSPTSAVLTSPEDPLPALTYSTNEVEATKYTFGLRYSPVEDLMLRASYGTGFLPPSIHQIVPDDPSRLSRTLTDPKRGGVSATVGPFIRYTGGNPDLVPEESESWSIGAVFTPRGLPGLRLSLDYTHIEKTDEISGLGLQQVLDLEHLFPDRVTRDPLTDTDRALGYMGGAITAIDASLLNFAATRLKAYDVQADYTWETDRLGEFQLYLIATWQPQFERQALPTSAFVDSAGFNLGPLQWRGNAGVTWDRGPWTLGWNVEYYDSYFAYAAGVTAATIASATLNQGSAEISHRIYHDLFARYRFDRSSKAMGGALVNAEIRLGIENVFDESPPILATTGATGGYSTYGDPRLQRFSITARKHF